MKSLKVISLLWASLVLIGGCQEIRPDQSALSASDAGDYTLTLTGCRTRLMDNGGLFCRVSAESDPKRIWFRVQLAPLNCKRESCAEVVAFDKSGTLIALGGIPKGHAHLDFPLSKLVQSPDAIRSTDSGEYEIRARVLFELPDGEHSASGSGIIRLIVLKPGYVPLGCNGPSVAFEKSIDDVRVQYSTKFRSTICLKRSN